MRSGDGNLVPGVLWLGQYLWSESFEPPPRPRHSSCPATAADELDDDLDITGWPALIAGIYE